MQVLESCDLAWVAGGKVASGGRFPAAPSGATASGTANVSGSSNTTTTVTVVCNGSVTTQVVLWGAWQKTQCEASSSGNSKEAPQPASTPASGPSRPSDGQWKAYYWEEPGN